jgi:hypothetical protein
MRLPNFKITKFYHVVTNTIDNELFILLRKTEKSNDLMLCIVSVYGSKNQLNLIKAIKDFNGLIPFSTRLVTAIIPMFLFKHIKHFFECKTINS